jgi:hypothetical protein
MAVERGCIKGVVLKSRLGFVRESKGEPGLRSVLARLPEADRALLDSLLPSSWYPSEMGERLDQAIAQEMGRGSGIFTVLGERSAADNLGTSHRAFVDGKDPHGLLRHRSAMPGAGRRRLHVRVRVGVSGLGAVLGGLVLLCLWPPPVGAQPPIRPPSSPRPPIDVVLPCGEPGQACCRWPGAPPDAVNPVHCNSGAGCDITTNTCVASCGGGGQVCCDGPDTRAIQWKPDGRILQPSGPLVRDMCEGGICLDSRRCDVSCGRTAGAPCCPPDVAIGSATCKQGNLICAHDPNTFKSGTCLACGDQGQPPCDLDGCRFSAGSVRTVERNGVCVACGLPGTPKCSGLRKCGAGTAPDPRRDQCVIAGGKDELCLEGGFCGFDGMFCDASNKCRLCGQPGQRCCPDRELLGGGRLLECGGFSNVACEGSPEQRFCHLTPPPASGGPPPSNPPRTCSGQPFGIGITTPFEIWVREGSGCAKREAVLFANSPAEALGCAHNSFSNVIADVVQEFRVKATSPASGCNGYTIVAKDDEDAKSCAQALCGIDCGEAELGECP